MRKIYFLIISMICATISLYAQEDTDNLTVDLQLRSRAEVRDGSLMPKTENDDIAAFVNNRTRLNLGYKKDFLKVKLSLQHVGVWGDDRQVHKASDLSVHEAWANMTFKEHFFVKLGRQIISYDDQRVLGALEWHVAGRHHDALKLGYEDEKNKLHLILAYNQNKENVHGNFYDSDMGQPYKTIQTLWYNVSPSSSAKLSFLFMNLGFQEGKDVNYMQTLGTYMVFALSPKVKTNISGYYQMGNVAKDLKIAAYMLSANFNFKLADNTSLSLGTDYLSGNKRNNDKVTAFNPLYGTHHKFYGHMDYFYVAPFIDSYKPGLWDINLGVNHSFSSKFSGGLKYHYFQFTGDVLNTSGENISKKLASELDVNMKYKFSKDVTLVGGFSFAKLSESMEVVKGGDSEKLQSWAWLSLNVSPRIFSK